MAETEEWVHCGCGGYARPRPPASCGHRCCEDTDPLHDHFLRPVDCRRCTTPEPKEQTNDN